MPETQTIPYGDWGYGIQTPIADAMRTDMDEHKLKFEGESRERVYREHKGAYDALAKYVEQVWKVESDYSKSIEAKLREERHSGHGRGDSMG